MESRCRTFHTSDIDVELKRPRLRTLGKKNTTLSSTETRGYLKNAIWIILPKDRVMISHLAWGNQDVKLDRSCLGTWKETISSNAAWIKVGNSHTNNLVDGLILMSHLACIQQRRQTRQSMLKDRRRQIKTNQARRRPGVGLKLIT